MADSEEDLAWLMEVPAILQVCADRWSLRSPSLFLTDKQRRVTVTSRRPQAFEEEIDSPRDGIIKWGIVLSLIWARWV